MRVPADDEALLYSGQRGSKTLVGGDAREDLVVVARGAVAVEDAAERHGMRQRAEKLDRRRVEFPDDPLPGPRGSARRLPVCVAAHEHRVEGNELVEALARKRACDHVTAADDPVDLERRDLGEHGLERRQVAVDVVQSRNAH